MNLQPLVSELIREGLHRPFGALDLVSSNREVTFHVPVRHDFVSAALRAALRIRDDLAVGALSAPLHLPVRPRSEGATESESGRPALIQFSSLCLCAFMVNIFLVSLW